MKRAGETGVRTEILRLLSSRPSAPGGSGTFTSSRLPNHGHHSPDSPRYCKQTSEQRQQLEGVLGQIGGKDGQVKEVEDEELHGLGHVLPVDLYFPPRLSKGPEGGEAQQAQAVH